MGNFIEINESQKEEIIVIRSTFDTDYTECPPPAAWKAAVRLPEFTIKITHSTQPSIFFHLHTKFPKTYPTMTCPTFTASKPTYGIDEPTLKKLTQAIHAETKVYRGDVMVVEICAFAQNWITENIVTKKEVRGSLATEMRRRAVEQENAEKARAEMEADHEAKRAAAAAELKTREFQDAQRQQLAQEHLQRARRRAESNATEMPEAYHSPIPTRTFNEEIDCNDTRFTTVRIFHPQEGLVGTRYLADPVFQGDHLDTVPLELFEVVFDSPYYSTSQGRKKLRELEAEIDKLIPVTRRHPNLHTIFAVKLTTPQSGQPPILDILTEEQPPLTLHELLEDFDCLREDRAADYVKQILKGLNAIHGADIVHRGINTLSIGLAKPHMSNTRVVKICKTGYYARLLDLQKSNDFHNADVEDDYPVVPLTGDWRSKEEADSPLTYTRSRDIHNVGVILAQMLLGSDIVLNYPPQIALHASGVSPAMTNHINAMLFPAKRAHVSCTNMLAALSESAMTIELHNSAMVIPGRASPKTPMPTQYSSSPEMDRFFAEAARPQSRQQVSRWREDWEELEQLGKGAFGSVVKARLKIDSRIYAVKKIRLRKNDKKMLREVNAISGLSHRFIVRYYTTWMETTEAEDHSLSDTSSDESGSMTNGHTSMPQNNGRGYPDNKWGSRSVSSGSGSDNLSFGMSDLDASSNSQTSFQGVFFDKQEEEDDDDDDSEGSDDSSDDEDYSDRGNLTLSPSDVDFDSDVMFEADGENADFSDFDHSPYIGRSTARNTPSPLRSPFPQMTRTLYIQMEFVERQTLQERIQEGISEDEAWRLFQQILDALVYMSGLGILHRDIKLTNIFIDVNGDCKIGDFGLATSSLAAADPTNPTTRNVIRDPDMTLEVGTALYIAPEVSRRGAQSDHTKADLYSLGIVFFEMNYQFGTRSERVMVIDGLRKPDIIFPLAWEAHRTRQRQIITWLLKHKPADRPTALELSQSSLMPPRVEDEYFKGALSMMAQPDSAHYQAVISSLFSQPPRPVRAFIYDVETEPLEHAALYPVVQETLTAVFRLHGAVDMEVPLLMPIMDTEDEVNHATFLDRHGDVVTLPYNILLPFARSAARANHTRIKRFHLSDVYRPSAAAGHPRATKAAVFDIITPDMENGPVAAGGEILTIANDLLNTFPTLADSYEVHISHTKIVEVAFNRVPEGHRAAILEILNSTKPTALQKRASLLKQGILRSTADELELLASIDDDVDAMMDRLEKLSPNMRAIISVPTAEIKATIQHAQFAGFNRQIFFRPILTGVRQKHFKDGVIFELVKKNKRTDVLAAGGRYDKLIDRYSAPTTTPKVPICAFGIQIDVEKISIALAGYQSSSVKPLVKDERSFGFWSARRCDVYVVSYKPGYLKERLEICSLLWKANITADLMYDSSLVDDSESHIDGCAREGILFTVTPRAGRRDQPGFLKVRSVLRRTEHEIPKHELVSFLHKAIEEQKRIDLTTSGAPGNTELPMSQSMMSIKDTSIPSADVQILTPIDAKKQRKQTKHLFTEKAYEAAERIRSAAQSGLPVVAIDVPPSVFDMMSKGSAFITDDDQWKTVLAGFPTQHNAYAQQIREALAKRRTEVKYILLFGVREERICLLHLR